MCIFWIFRKHYKNADLTEKQKLKSHEYKAQVVELTPKQIRERLIALFLVFFVVIFFWMSFQQNGLCMTFFARDYTQPTVGGFTNLFFDLFGLLPILISVIGFVYLVKKEVLQPAGLSAELFLPDLRFSPFSGLWVTRISIRLLLKNSSISILSSS